MDQMIMTRRQLRVLGALDTEHFKGTGTLARETGLPRGGRIYTPLQAGVKWGWVEKQRVDKTCVWGYRLTAEGSEVVDRSTRELTKIQESLRGMLDRAVVTCPCCDKVFQIVAGQLDVRWCGL